MLSQPRWKSCSHLLRLPSLLSPTYIQALRPPGWCHVRSAAQSAQSRSAIQSAENMECALFPLAALLALERSMPTQRRHLICIWFNAASTNLPIRIFAVFKTILVADELRDSTRVGACGEGEGIQIAFRRRRRREKLGCGVAKIGAHFHKRRERGREEGRRGEIAEGGGGGGGRAVCRGIVPAP